MSPGPSIPREMAYSPAHPTAGFRAVSDIPGGLHRHTLSPREREQHSMGYGRRLSVSPPPCVPEPPAERSRDPPPYTASASPARQSPGPASSADSSADQQVDKGKGRAQPADEDVNMEEPAQVESREDETQQEVRVKREPGLEDHIPAPKHKEKQQAAPEQEDIKPTLEELEAVVPAVDNPDAAEGVLAFRSDDIPYKCQSAPTSEERQAARNLFKAQQRAALALKGRKITRTVWRDDGVAFDWARSKTLLALPRVQAAKGEINVVPDDESEMEVEENVGTSGEKPGSSTGVQGAQAQKATKQTSASSLAVSEGSSTLPEASSSSAGDVEMHEDSEAVGKEAVAAAAASMPSAASAQAPDVPSSSASAPPPPPAAPAALADTTAPSTPARSKKAPSVARSDRAPPAPHILGGNPPPLAPGSIDSLYFFQITLPSHLTSSAACNYKYWATQACERYVDETRFMRVFVTVLPEYKDGVAHIYIEPISMETARSFPDSMLPTRTLVDYPAHLRNMKPENSFHTEWVHEQLVSASEPDKRGRPTKWVKPLRAPKGIMMHSRDRTPTEIASGGVDQATLDEVEIVCQMTKGQRKKHLTKLAEAAAARVVANAKEEEEMNSGLQASTKLPAVGNSARPDQAVGSSRGGFIPKREYLPVAGSSSAAPRTLAVDASARVGGSGGAGARAVAAGTIGSGAGQGRAPHSVVDSPWLATLPMKSARVAGVGANTVRSTSSGRPALGVTPSATATRTLRPAGPSITRPPSKPTAFPSSVSVLPTNPQASTSQDARPLSLDARLYRISESMAPKRSLETVGQGDRVGARSAGVERPQKVQKMEEGHRTVQARVPSGSTASPAIAARVPSGSTATPAIATAATARAATKPNPPPSSSTLTSVFASTSTAAPTPTPTSASAPTSAPTPANALPPTRLDVLNQQLSRLLLDINLFTDMMDEMPSARKQVDRLQGDIIKLYKQIGEEKKKGAGKKEH
ncbi:hypothetical protein IAT38_006170 [Cryptococcus sp. DSM 104549]